jgi:hypothetical protein
MSRTAVYRRKSGALDPIQVWTEDPAQEDLDDAVIDHEQHSYGLGELYNARQYVVYSPTFRVPAFYFTMHDSRTYCNSIFMYSDLLQRDDRFRSKTS